MKFAAVASALFVMTCVASAAQTLTVGPLTICNGDVASFAVYNSSAATLSGRVELLDGKFGTTLDVQPVVLASSRGSEVAFTRDRAFLGRTPPAATSDCRSAGSVVLAITFDAPDESGAVSASDLAVWRANYGSTTPQKTIIGGFKSMSGMDSETEVVESRSSRPFFQNSGKNLYLYRVANTGEQDVTLTVQVVDVKGGSVLSTQTFNAPARRSASMEIYGWSHEVVSPRDAASSSPHVLRLTALTGKAGNIAVSIDTADGLDSYTF